MCGRYIARRIDFRRFAFRKALLPIFEEFTEKPRYTPGGGSPSQLLPKPPPEETSPTDRSEVIRVIGDEMRVDILQWGLVPPFSPEPKTKFSTFNAKAETVATTATFRHAWSARQRCLVPVEAFIEWKGTKPPKQKFRISVKGETQFCLAGLWEKWQRGSEVLETYTVITTEANSLVAEIHAKKRMPVIIAPGDYDRWLHDAGDVSDLLKPYPSELMEAIVESKNPSKEDSRDGFLF